MKKSLFLILLLLPLLCNSQYTPPNPQADSVYKIWKDATQHDTVRLDALDDFCWNFYLYTHPDSAFYFSQQGYNYAKKKSLSKSMANALNTMGVSFGVRGRYKKALDFYQRALTIQNKIDNKRGIANVVNKIGNVYNRLGDYPKALEYYQKSLIVNEQMENKQGVSDVLNNIGTIYYHQKDYQKTLEYYKKSLAIAQEINDQNGVAGSLNNLGGVYADMKDFPKALDNYLLSLSAFEKMENLPGMANALANIGTNYRDLGNNDRALAYYKKGLNVTVQAGDNHGTASALIHIGRIYFLKSNFLKAISESKKGLTIAKKSADLHNQQLAAELLYQANKKMGNNAEALQYYELSSMLNDSLYNEENTKKLTRLEMQYGFDKEVAAAKAEQEKKNALASEELCRQKLMRNGFIGGFAIVLLFAGVFFIQRNRIGKEKQRSEHLLLNILPEKIASELKENGSSEAQLVEQVSVLFTDFKGFTAMSEILSPKELVKDLHECFSAFDKICEKYGIEKIKTIGDAYMAVGGLPTPNTTHAKDVVQAAIEMAQVVEDGKQKKKAADAPFFEVRIGIHTGPVVAGIVGVKKFQYDIWGDTVNTASRIESSGAVGKVNISDFTYEILKEHNDLSFEYRGEIAAKGKGEMKMWFVERSLGG